MEDKLDMQEKVSLRSTLVIVAFSKDNLNIYLTEKHSQYEKIIFPIQII